MKTFLTARFLLIVVGCLQISETAVRISDEPRQHTIAARIGEFSQGRWGYAGQRLDSVQNMLSEYLRVSVWCFEKQFQNVRVARCTTKARLDSVVPGEYGSFTYRYYPAARSASISIPVFLDTCYRCGYRPYRYYTYR